MHKELQFLQPWKREIFVGDFLKFPSLSRVIPGTGPDNGTPENW